MAEDWKEQYDYYFNKVNNANLESANKQMEFQERMSSSAHEREVKDLIAAGLNPVLSANNGASSPMGAYANVDSSPISAKFARQNLNKELENARTIQAMQNDNSYKIAMAQLANQMELGKYTVDTQTKTQRFDTIVSEYGLLAGLAYGLAEGMYNGDTKLEGAVNSVLDSGNQLNSVWDLYNSAKKSSQQGIDSADNTLDEAARNLGYKDYADMKLQKSNKALANKALAKIRSEANMRYTGINRKIISAKKKLDHKKAFNKFSYR